ncbi:MAG: STAS domain-containing protein [Deltaproteobacteria bacterium]|nr:STAS domain-containing protein [Deltaproteobacteria bacterium]
MNADITEDGGVLVMNARGRLDAANAAVFDDGAKEILAAEPKNVLLDLDGLDFISSAGLRSVLTLAKGVRKNGQKLAFCSLPPVVNDVFKIAGFMEIMQVFATRDEAMAFLLSS